MNTTVIGFLAVFGSIVSFGSFGLPIKSRKVQEAKVDPLIFQIYMSVSIFCTSWLVLAYVPFVFTYFGILSACLWVPASILSIFAIRALGLSISQGTWSGITIIVSFIWGVIFPAQGGVKNWPLSILALVLLMVGIAGLSLCNTPFMKRLLGIRDEDDETAEKQPLVVNHSEPSMSSTESGAQSPPTATAGPSGGFRQRLFGFSCAGLLGLMNGSMFVPLHFAPKEAQGINYIISFAIGVICVTPVLATLYFAARRTMPVFHLKITLLPGLLTGVFWNLGNYCSIYAVLYLGLTVGFPLTQVALLVAGLWGLFLFKEVRHPKFIAQFFISAAILLTGAALLGVYG